MLRALHLARRQAYTIIIKLEPTDLDRRSTATSLSLMSRVAEAWQLLIRSFIGLLVDHAQATAAVISHIDLVHICAKVHDYSWRASTVRRKARTRLEHAVGQVQARRLIIESVISLVLTEGRSRGPLLGRR